MVDAAGTTAPLTPSLHGEAAATVGWQHTTQPMNHNLQQLFYQMIAYGSSYPSSSGCVPFGPWPESQPPFTTATPTGLNVDCTACIDLSDNVQEQVSRMLRELGFASRGCAKSYCKPYPEYFDSVPYPRGFHVPDFIKFTRDDARTTYEHIGQYLTQVSDVGMNDVHRVRLFLLSLSSMAFNWFTSLAPNSAST
jgi:hypothetical protein